MRAALLTYLSLKSPSCTGFTLRATRVQANLESSAAAGFTAAERSGFLAGEEGLGLSAGGVDTERTAEGELTGTRLVGLQMGLNQIRQRLRERHLVRPLYRQHPTPSVWRMVNKVERNMMPASKMPWFNRENNTRMHCNKLRKKIKDGKF